MHCSKFSVPDFGIRSFRIRRLRRLLLNPAYDTRINIEFKDSQGKTALMHAIKKSNAIAFQAFDPGGSTP